MKLFIGRICCSDDIDEFDTELLVAESESQAEEQLKKKYSDFIEYFQWVEVREIKEIDGWKVTLSK